VRSRRTARPFAFHGNNALFAVPQAGPSANIAFSLRECAGARRVHRADSSSTRKRSSWQSSTPELRDADLDQPIEPAL
jgi:hypothetical protein